MGILLPPVAQVTTVTNTLTMHHRNRSLDSALQRIPEVDITPSPECEPSVCSTILLSAETTTNTNKVSKATREELTSLGSDDSGILCGSDNGTRESSVELLSTAINSHSRESLDSDPMCLMEDIDSDEAAMCYETNSNSDCEQKQDESGLCCGVIRGENSELCCEQIIKTIPSKDWMLRLLESKMFDITMAMHYLFKSKEPGVQSYIANKMFSFPMVEVDFYLPQLVCMYIQMDDVAEAIHPYLVHR